VPCEHRGRARARGQSPPGAVPGLRAPRTIARRPIEGGPAGGAPPVARTRRDERHGAPHSCAGGR
jgi:hypothetical protein